MNESVLPPPTSPDTWLIRAIVINLVVVVLLGVGVAWSHPVLRVTSRTRAPPQWSGESVLELGAPPVPRATLCSQSDRLMPMMCQARNAQTRAGKSFARLSNSHSSPLRSICSPRLGGRIT